MFRRWFVGMVMLSIMVSFVGCAGKQSRGPVAPRPAAQESSNDDAVSTPTHVPQLVTAEGARTVDASAGSGGGASSSGDDMQVSGMMGTIDEAAVAKAFRSKRYAIESCILDHARPMTYLTGVMNFQFEVMPSGTIHLKVLDDTVGNFQVEECLLGVARSLKFGRPKGGKVKIAYPLQIPARGTPHQTWGRSRVRPKIHSQRSKILACRRQGRPRHFTLHFYVLPGGKMISLGVFAPKGVPDGFARCVFDVLKNVDFPDPLGKVAKVRYRL